MTNYVARFLDSNTIITGALIDTGTAVGIGVSSPSYTLEVAGDIGIQAGSDLYIGTIGLGSTGPNATSSGAYLVGVFDEFDYSDSANVQGVLNDFDTELLDINTDTTNLIGSSHPALSLAAGLDYLSLTGSTQILTLNQIDLTTDVSGILSSTYGGTGINGGTAPEGTLLIGNNTGYSLSLLGGDATIASNGTLTLANSGVSADTYGSATGIPILTVDAKGRITGASTSPIDLSIYTDGTGTQNYLPIWSDSNTLSDSVVYQTGGLVGIGTTNPTQELHVQGSARLTGALYDSSGDVGGAGQVLSSTGSAINWISAATGNIDGSGMTNYVARFLDSNTIITGALIDTGTAVGIGVSSPFIYLRGSRRYWYPSR